MAYTVQCQSFISRQSYSYFRDMIADVLAYVHRTAGDVLKVYENGDIYGFIVVDSKLEAWWFKERAASPLTQASLAMIPLAPRKS